MLKEPPDVLITTPESLYLMLTSRAREFLRDAETVIVDEIHAVAGTKRGAHLALSLERLEAAADGNLQRIGLSATQNPLEEIGRFLVGPQRTCRIVDTGVRKPLDLKIQVPVESMVEPDEGSDPLDPLAGGEATRRSIWPAIYPELLALVKEHRSTIVFVNNRRGAERLALRLNELAEEPHRPGPPRLAGPRGAPGRRGAAQVRRPALPRGDVVARARHRHGRRRPRAPGRVAEVRRLRPAADRPRRPRRRRHLARAASSRSSAPTCSSARSSPSGCTRRRSSRPSCRRNPLDVLAQQIVAIAAIEEEVAVDDLFALVTRTYSYSDLSRSLFESVLDMLDGRYPSSDFAELRPRIVWDRLGGVIRPRKGARQLAITNAGTIPDRGLFSVTLPDGRRVGELDEEMVYEARPGQTFLLGASSWRIEEIGRDRVIVTPAPGVPGAVPFWKGDTVGRPKELGAAVGAFARETVGRSVGGAGRRVRPRRARGARTSSTTCPSSRPPPAWSRATRRSSSSASATRSATGACASCRPSAVACTPPGAWPCRRGSASSSASSPTRSGPTTGSSSTSPTPTSRRAPTSCSSTPTSSRTRVVAELSSSALFGARFRENAGRSLLLPRAYPGKRTPLWQQRLKSQSLLEVAKQYGDFPIVLETYRECLRDVLDVPGARDLLAKLHRRELTLVEVETPTASPFASSLLFDYVATYMYEGDTPNAERRAAALSLDRDLLRELLGQEELRELIDPDALQQVEDDLQRRSERTRASSRDELHDVLRRVGDLAAAEVAARVTEGVAARPMLDELERERRAIRLRIGGEERWIAAEDAGLYRDARRRRPARRPARGRSSPTSTTRCASSCAATPARTGRSPPTRSGRATASTPTAVLRELERGRRRDPRRAAPGRHRARVVRRRGAAAAAPRLAGRPAQGDRARRPARTSPPSCPRWQNVDRHAAAGAGIDRLREVLVPLQGLALTPDTWEKDVLPRRIGAYSPTWMDQLCASGEVVWVGAGSLGPHERPRRAVLPRGRRRARPARAPGHARAAVVARPRPRPRAARAGRLLLHRPARRRRPDPRGAAGGAVGPRLGRRGDQRRLGAAARAAADPRPRPARPGAPRGGRAASPRGAARPPRRSRAAGR